MVCLKNPISSSMAVLLFVFICLESGACAEEDLVVYQLYTRQNPTYRQTVHLYDFISLETSNFNSSLPTKIFCVGWDDDTHSANSTRKEYLIKEDCNFFAVDWQAYVNVTSNQPSDVRNATQEAGYHLAKFIDWLVEVTETPIESFHLIGHSAGTHLVGAAGSAVRSGRIARITGLDPAEGGVYHFNDTENRLDISDGEFVDIMHTNGGLLVAGNIAFLEAMGHVDFYVNGGQKQPGCPPLEFQCCSHCQAIDYFAESINTDVGFLALRCDTYEDYLDTLCDDNDRILMGDPTPTSARGIYYLDTNPVPPYANGSVPILP